MARNLYRFYLYAVFIAMLIFATVGLGRLLQPLLSETPLRGDYGTTPANTDIVQAAVFFIVSWIIAGLLGGLHYWLIRRDMQNEPAAAGSAIRAFFLNVVELIAAPLAVALGAFAVIDQLGLNPAANVSGPAAFAIATLFVLGVLEWERQRTPASPGAAVVFQRFHLYVVQLILLIMLAFAWLSMVNHLLDAVIFNGSATGITPCGGFTGCQNLNLLSLVAGTLWIVLFWIGYGFVARGDTSSLLRQVLHFASFALGVGYVLFGIERGIELALLTLFKVSVSKSEVLGMYDFTSLITLGLLIIGVYGLWLWMAAHKQQPAGGVTTVLVVEAITTALLAASFWWGMGLVLLNALEGLAGAQLGPHDWAPALAFVITGLAYIPLDLYLHRRYVQDTAIASGPRHGFVFALLGGGILAGAIGGAVALYALSTSLLGSPFDNWQHVARIGAAAFIIGVVVLVIYLWTARREQLLRGLGKQPTALEVPATQPVAKPRTIEDVLDELLAGKISRDEAALQIHAMTNVQPAQAHQ